MRTETLSRKVDTRVALIEPSRIQHELKSVGFGALARARPYSLEVIRDNVMYDVPVLSVFEFERFIEHLGAKKVNRGSVSSRHAVYFLHDAMISSPKKGASYSLVDDNHPANITLRRVKAIDEFVDRYTKFDGFIWRPITLVESQEIKKGEVLGGEVYLVSRNPIRFPVVSGELKPEHFEDPAFYDKAMNGYKNFLSKVDELGFEYVSSHKQLPFSDLYMRVNSRGNVEVFANDVSHIQKKK